MHTYPKAKRYVLLLVLLLFSLSTLGCGLLGKLGQAVSDKEISGEQPPAGEKPPAEQEPPVGDKPPAEQEPPTEQEPPVGQELPSEGNPPAGKGSEGVPLDSFRSHTVMQTKDQEGNVTMVVITDIEWTRDPPALRTVTSSESGETTMEMIIVEGTAWTKMTDGSWHKLEEAEDMSMDPQEHMPEVPNVENMDFKGDETVNGIKCKHYASKGGLQYQVWIADQKDVPEMVIRAVTQMGPVSTEIDILDINVPITIEPPQ
jgi:hypothetical protein